MNRSLWSGITLRYLFGKGPMKKAAMRRIRGGVLGIAFSMLPLVLVYEVASGMVEGISVRFLETWSGHITMSDTIDRTTDQLLESARDLENNGLANYATVEIEGTALLKGPKGSAGVMIRAVEPDRMVRDSGFARYMQVQQGSFELSEQSDLVIGEAIANKIGADVGDQIRLLSYNTSSWGGLPHIAVCTVRGIVSSGYQDLDRLWIFMPLSRAEKLLSQGTSRGSLLLKLADPYQLPNALVYRGPTILGPEAKTWADFGAYQSAVQAIVGSEWIFNTWFEMQEAHFNHYNATKNIIVFILILMVLIAMVNVSSTMILFFVEKQQDIAILRAVGASRSQITRVFILMGALTGSMGAALGILGGIGLSGILNQLIQILEALLNALLSLGGGESFKILDPAYYLSDIPIRIHWADQLLIFGLALVLSLWASWLPARRAARMGVLEIIRKA